MSDEPHSYEGVKAERDRLADGARKLVAALDRQREAGHPVSPSVSISCNALRSLLDVAGDTAPPPGYVRLSDYHVDGCEFTTDDGWTCKPGCPSGDDREDG